jgi:Domain of unknown function (DUF1707)
MEAPVTEGPWDPITACLRTPHARLRASDADRERAIDTLANAFGQGRLTKDEFSVCAGEALASRTYGDLAAITFSIPPRPSEAPVPRTARAQNLDRMDRKTLAWAMFLLLMPATLGTGFVTHYIWFFVMFVAAFVGVTVTAQPDT